MYLNKRILIITLEAGYFIKVFTLTNKEATTNVLSSVVKEVGDIRARKKWRENEETYSSVFSYLLSALPLPNAIKQSRAQSRLLYLFYLKIPVTSLPIRMSFQTKLYSSNKEKWRQHSVYPAHLYDMNTP